MIDATAHHFILTAVGEGYAIRQISGDASFRTYYRVTHEGRSLVFMDAPPDKEDSHPFVDIARFLTSHGIPAPLIHHADVPSGHLLIEDFGDITYLEALRLNKDPESLYAQAVETLVHIQATPNNGQCMAHHRPYDAALLGRELDLFTDWYLEGILKQTLTPEDRLGFHTCFQELIQHLLTQPRVMVHRDYHSRNLMWREKGVGVLDFQDAVMGPITYDLASLLRDCYVAWDPPFRSRMQTLWLEMAKERLDYHPQRETFVRDFDFMALQRNLKAVGIFGRLSLRDGKHGYLGDIPRTMGYVHETLARYPALGPLSRLIMRYTGHGS